MRTFAGKITGMNILILGSGGREHALAWTVAQSPRCEKLYCAPGNGGTAAAYENVALDPMDFKAVGRFCAAQKMDMLIVGPEAPLVGGIADYFAQEEALRHIAVMGPGQTAAQLEGSKRYAKEFMAENGIPTARYRAFEQGQEADALAFLGELAPPYVLKADGLAGGKGVLILQERAAAEEEVSAMLGGKFGKASHTLVIEEFLAGREFSVFALTDGQHYRLLPAAVDYKRRGEGDTGLNTGGMGALSPVPFMSEALWARVEAEIVKPTLAGLQRRELDYRGFLFFGLMEVNGAPYVIEYNVRLGDPEAEVVLPRLEEDLLEACQQAWEGKLPPGPFVEKEDEAATVVAVMEGYPGSYPKGKAITGLSDVTEKDTLLFQAGTRQEADGKTYTAGGRVLALTGLGKTREAALEICYAGARKVCFEGIDYRRDIGGEWRKK